MIFKFKEEEFRKDYKKYINIFPIIATVMLILCMMAWGMSMQATIGDTFTSMCIIIFVVGLPILIITAAIYAVYETKINNYLESKIKINTASMEFKKYIPERSENKVVDKYKIMKITNIQKIEETSYAYKVTGNVETYIESQDIDNIKNIADSMVSIDKTVRIPKHFGDKKIFEEELYKLVQTNKKKKKKEYLPFTVIGLIELIIASVSFMLFWTIKNNNLVSILTWIITEYIAIKSIYVLKEENRDKLVCIVNLILGAIQLLIGCILVFL